MFFDEQTERALLHNSTSKKPYDNKKIGGSFHPQFTPIQQSGNHPAKRVVGGSSNKRIETPRAFIFFIYVRRK